MAHHKLNMTIVKAAKPDKEKKYELSDGGGLYLRVQPLKKPAPKVSDIDGDSRRESKPLSTELPTKTWYFVYRSPELCGTNGKPKQQWMCLGEYPDVPLYDDTNPENGARGKAAAARILVDKGIDPLLEQQRQAVAREVEKRKEAQLKAIEDSRPQTVEALFYRWKETELITLFRDDEKTIVSRPGVAKEGKEHERALKKDVFPTIGKLHPNEVEEYHIQVIGDAINARGAKRQAGQVLTYLKQMFKWGRRRKYLAHNPTEDIPVKEFGSTGKVRDRHLSDDEVKELARKMWRKVGRTHALPRHSQLILLLQLATVCRIGELERSEWKNVNFEARTLFLPKEIRKSKRNYPAKDHTVYLSDLAIKILTELHRWTGHTAWLFPDRATAKVKWDGTEEMKGSHLCEGSISKDVAYKQGGEVRKGKAKDCSSLQLTKGNWQPRDLRRTAATLITQLAIQQKFSAVDATTLTRRCLSHFEPDRLNQTYLKYGYDDEMKKAWSALGEYLEKLIPKYVLDPLPLPSERKKRKVSPKWKAREIFRLDSDFGEPVAGGPPLNPIT